MVAEPTIFSEGVLIGSKAVRLYALDAATGTPHYYQDTSSATCADAACAVEESAGAHSEALRSTQEQSAALRSTQPPHAVILGGDVNIHTPGADGGGVGGASAAAAEARRRAAAERSRRAQLFISRADYSLRVLDRHDGRQRWNLSLAQFSIEVVGGEMPQSAGDGHRGAGRHAELSRHLALEIRGGHALCAAHAGTVGGGSSSSSSGGGGGGGGGDGSSAAGESEGSRAGAGAADGPCAWTRTFSSPPVILYHIDTSAGLQQRFNFAPRPRAISRLAMNAQERLGDRSVLPSAWEDDGTAAGAVRGALSTSLAQGTVFGLEAPDVLHLTLPDPPRTSGWLEGGSGDPPHTSGWLEGGRGEGGGGGSAGVDDVDATSLALPSAHDPISIQSRSNLDALAARRDGHRACQATLVTADPLDAVPVVAPARRIPRTARWRHHERGRRSGSALCGRCLRGWCRRCSP